MNLPKLLKINDHLLLKPLAEGDANILFSLVDCNRDRLKQWLPWLDFTKSESDSLDFIRKSQSEMNLGASHVFGVWLDNKLAGVASLQNISKSNRSAAIGYWVGKDFTGYGIALQSTQKLVEYAFEILNFQRIEIRCATENLNSQRIPEGLGFHFEGTSRACEWLYDKFVDHKVYSILRSDSSLQTEPK